MSYSAVIEQDCSYLRITCHN